MTPRTRPAARPPRAPAWIAAAGLLAACAGGPSREASWAPLDPARLEGARRAQYERALVAREALFGELMGALGSELEARGPAAAIAVCRERAPALAAAVSELHGLRIGRTSWKLRNPDNAAPAWAAALLAKRPTEPRAAADGTGQLGALLPIRVAGRCLTCHGPEESIAGDVRAALAALYPGDTATGFREGDLRGWFWVEVPPASADGTAR